MTTEGRVWQKPELIVLVRGQAEEAVLAACKHVVHPAPMAPDHQHFMCGYLDFPCVVCELLFES